MEQQKEEHPLTTLTPINLHNHAEYAELQTQRQICGWDFTDEVLLKGRQKQDANLKSFFWITIPSPAPDSSDIRSENLPTNAEGSSIIRTGHISLDAYADPSDPELARADRSVLTIQTFFVRPEYRALGHGRAAMDQVEAMAGQEPYGSPWCKYVAVTTISKRHFHDDIAGLEGTGLSKILGAEKPPLPAADWYQRRGYAGWKSEKRWTDPTRDEGEALVFADFMSKPVQRSRLESTEQPKSEE